MFCMCTERSADRSVSQEVLMPDDERRSLPRRVPHSTTSTTSTASPPPSVETVMLPAPDPDDTPLPDVLPGSMVSLRGTTVAWETLAQRVGKATDELTLSDVDRYIERVNTELRQTSDHLKEALGKAMQARLHPPSAVITEVDAARLILSKCTADTVERFGIARETAPPGMSDANIIASLLTMLCNQNEQHTGDYESINQQPVTLPVNGFSTHTRSVSPPPGEVIPFGREPRPCKTCGAVFHPQRQGQVYGCNACGEYPNYIRIVKKDRLEYDPHRALDPFPTFCLKKSIQCTCPGMVAPHVMLQSPAQAQDLPTTRPRMVTNAQGQQMIVDEVVADVAGSHE